MEELIDERRRRHEFEKDAERKQRENESVCIVSLCLTICWITIDL